jgi:hypothetical protein
MCMYILVVWASLPAPHRWARSLLSSCLHRFYLRYVLAPCVFWRSPGIVRWYEGKSGISCEDKTPGDMQHVRQLDVLSVGTGWRQCFHLYPEVISVVANLGTDFWFLGFCTPCRIPKTKNQYSSHGESLKSNFGHCVFVCLNLKLDE